MKYLILSDIHGSLPQLQKVLDYYEHHHFDMLIILGDILNYGPRNGVPEGLDAPGIVSRLNTYSSQVLAVRGNCDSEVDQMLLHFPCMADYAMLVIEGKRIFLTHGHRYSEDNIPLGVDAFFCGHTHLWKLERKEGVLVCNTGSITFPKGGNPPTFCTIIDGMVNVHTLDTQIISSAELTL